MIGILSGYGCPYSISKTPLAQVQAEDTSSWIICGGIETGQTTSDRVFLLELDLDVSIAERDPLDVEYSLVASQLTWQADQNVVLQVRTVDGRRIMTTSQKSVDLSGIVGVILLDFVGESGRRTEKLVLSF